MALKELSSNRSFNGYQKVFEHTSHVLKCQMKFGAYIPDDHDQPLPVLFYLSGLTCTEANFIDKSGFQRFASAAKCIVINPDTSPRGIKIEGDDESYDFGTGAGFYLLATEAKWAEHYRMYSYVVDELYKAVVDNFKIDTKRVGIFGHSMGGHGALIIGLRNPQLFRSVSAFAPICNPINCPWGHKAFKGYLGSIEAGAEYDATELAKTYDGPERTILIDQGLDDQFLKEQLLPENLLAVKNPKLKFDYRARPKYNHSYFYIATFIEEHFKFHLNA